MRHSDRLTIDTSGRGMWEITERIDRVVRDLGASDGLCHLFLHHTSASLVLCENADPSVRRDLERFFARLVPDGDPIFKHVVEGPDDMPAHLRTILTQNSLMVPVRDGSLDLGTWQGVFVWEHRISPQRRRLTVTLLD